MLRGKVERYEVRYKIGTADAADTAGSAASAAAAKLGEAELNKVAVAAEKNAADARAAASVDLRASPFPAFRPIGIGRAMGVVR